MTLREYLEKRNETNLHFAERIGVHEITVCHWVTGKSMPTAEHMRLIARRTQSAVQPNDFVRNHKRRKWK